MMNFGKLAESQYTDKTCRDLFGLTHKFDVGLWKSIPKEMVSFGGMLLQDKVFKLPFPLCMFGGDHDFIENQFGYPDGMESALENPGNARFPWIFKRNDELNSDDVLTKSIAIEAIDLTEFGELRTDIKQLCSDRGSEMNADFMMKICTDFGRSRGWEWVGSMVLDQGGDFHWNPQTDVMPGVSEKSERLGYFFSYAMGYFALNAVLGAVASLASKSTKQEIIPAPEKLNRARTKKGKLPIYEYRKITIGHNSDMPKTINGKSIEGRASPRLHWRRGHYRTLAPDVRVPVAPALVGLAENGIIDKDYIIKHARESLRG